MQGELVQGKRGRRRLGDWDLGKVRTRAEAAQKSLQPLIDAAPFPVPWIPRAGRPGQRSVDRFADRSRREAQRLVEAP